MKFSVIVPVFNCEKFLDELIESVLKQECDDFELIIVDDCSTDKSLRICEKYASEDRRIKILHKEKNGGSNSARKFGLEKASGEYIVCLDGDDFLDLNYLSEFNKIINKTSCDVVCCGAHYLYSKKVVDYPLKRYCGFYEKQDIVDNIFPSLIHNYDASYFPPSVWGKAFRKSLFERCQMAVDDRIKIGEDFACTIPCIANATSIYILEKCLYNYRQNMSSITKSKKPIDPNGPFYIKESLEKNINLELFDFKEQLKRKTLHELFGIVVSMFYKKQKYKITCKEINKILSIDFYRECIKTTHFRKSLRALLMLNALKHKWFFLMKIYSVIKR